MSDTKRSDFKLYDMVNCADFQFVRFQAVRIQSVQAYLTPEAFRVCIPYAGSHKYDESHPHEEDGPPVLGDPLGDGQQGLLVEEQVLESHQGTLSVDLAALQEDVAVALWGGKSLISNRVSFERSDSKL